MAAVAMVVGHPRLVVGSSEEEVKVVAEVAEVAEVAVAVAEQVVPE